MKLYHLNTCITKPKSKMFAVEIIKNEYTCDQYICSSNCWNRRSGLLYNQIELMYIASNERFHNAHTPAAAQLSTLFSYRYFPAVFTFVDVNEKYVRPVNVGNPVRH